MSFAVTMSKQYTIPIVVTIEPTFQGKEFEEAKLLSEIIRDKIRKTMNDNKNVVKWSIDLPNETYEVS